MSTTTLPDGGLAYGLLNDQNTATPEAIVVQAYKFLESNLLTGTAFGFNYSFCKPSAYKYGPSQWLWDSGSHQITWSHKDVSRSIADLRGMLEMQLPNGRIPEEINWLLKKQSFLNDISSKLQYSHLRYTDITQMPVLPYSLRAIFEKTNDVELLKEMVPKIVKYFEWLKDERVINESGLVTILHPWESGLDLSPAYDPALGVPERARARPTWNQAYFPLIRLILEYNILKGWKQKKILSRKHASKISPFKSWFRVHDIAVNCVYASGWGVLGDLAATYDSELSKTCYTNQNIAETAILEHMYDGETHQFKHLWQAKDGTLQSYSVRTIQMLFPLLLSNLPPEALSEILRLLHDPNEFGTQYMIPTVSKAEKEYNPIANTLLLWRGPVWGFTNWFVLRGLEKHGQTDFAKEIVGKWIEMVEKSGIWEHYNPDTGVGYGAEGLGMSCLIVDFLVRYGIAQVPK